MNTKTLNFDGSEHGFDSEVESLKRRRAGLLALPSASFLAVFFLTPMLILVVYSFATRTRFGTDLSGWNLDSYRELARPLVLEVMARSTILALLTTILCLLVAFPFTYFMSTRSDSIKTAMLVLVMIPFWTNLLVRNYAWRIILSRGGPLASLGGLFGVELDLLFSNTAIVLGLVYGYLPFMILPLFAAIERIDPYLLEASRDLYSSRWQTLRYILIPLSAPGILAGSVLVFVPSLGAYVTPEILGGAKTTLLGSYVVTQFLTARNWPFGAALSFVLMAVMLLLAMLYFRKGGRTL